MWRNVICVLVGVAAALAVAGCADSGKPAGTTPNVSKAPASLPQFTHELSGADEVRVSNPNDFTVSVGVRTGEAGKDFEVGPNGTASVWVPNGHYEVYFIYSSKPEALFQGDSFTLANNGVEIQIVKVVSGNYSIRQVN